MKRGVRQWASENAEGRGSGTGRWYKGGAWGGVAAAAARMEKAGMETAQRGGSAGTLAGGGVWTEGRAGGGARERDEGRLHQGARRVLGKVR